jgi:hypothetical protein
MKKHHKFILIGLTTALAVGVVLYAANQNKKRRVSFQRQEVADEGYELAQDILFPMKNQLKKYKRKIV